MSGLGDGSQYSAVRQLVIIFRLEIGDAVHEFIEV